MFSFFNDINDIKDGKAGNVFDDFMMYNNITVRKEKQSCRTI